MPPYHYRACAHGSLRQRISLTPYENRTAVARRLWRGGFSFIVPLLAAPPVPAALRARHPELELRVPARAAH
eukprot:scaffold12567_cov143-Isochrysis_galbana.AAC.2